MSVSTPSPAGERLAPASLRDQIIHIPCPEWCVLDHVSEGEAFLEDVQHQGRTVELTAPVYGDTEEVLIAEIRQSPFARRCDSRPYLCLDASGDGEAAELTPTEALAFADQLVAHADTIRTLAATLAD